jgi:hypothetical protein
LQTTHLDGWDRAIGFRTDVEQKISVLTYDVDQEINQFVRSNGLGLTFGAVIAEGASKSAAFFPLGLADLVQGLVFRGFEIRVLDSEAVIDHAIEHGIVILRHNLEK